MPEKNGSVPSWISKFLKYTAFYHFGWGVFILHQPLRFWNFFQPTETSFSFALYFLGIIVLLMGAGYFYTAYKPLQTFGYLLFAAVGKAFGGTVAWFLANASTSRFNLFLHTFINDFLWIPIFLWIFYLLFKQWQNTEKADENPAFPLILHNFKTQEGETLYDLQQKQPIMLVFLRHFGCTFCREALLDLSAQKDILATKVKLVLVHMAEEGVAQNYLQKYSLENTARISDPTCALYRSFSLQRATFGQVFGIKTWVRGFQAGILKKQGVGKLVGDGFRMGGVFVIHRTQILEAFRHQTAADVPDYQVLSQCEIEVE